MSEYQRQLEKGSIQKAYQGLMQYYKDLRVHFCTEYPDYSVPSNIYFGRMDITFFAFSSPVLKERKLKALIVFGHEDFQFEIWLAGLNKKVQSNCLSLLKENNWQEYPLTETPKCVDYISKFVLDDDPNFDDLDALTKRIDEGAQQFVKAFEQFFDGL